MDEMTRQEAEALARLAGVDSVADLASLRDLLQQQNEELREQGKSLALLAGRFAEHADTEEHWQDKVDAWMRDEPVRVRDEVDKQVAACREQGDQRLEPYLEFVSQHRAQGYDRRAVQHFLGDHARRLLILCVFLALLAATVALAMDERYVAAQITGIITVATPFLLTLYRRNS